MLPMRQRILADLKLAQNIADSIIADPKIEIARETLQALFHRVAKKAKSKTFRKQWIQKLREVREMTRRLDWRIRTALAPISCMGDEGMKSVEMRLKIGIVKDLHKQGLLTAEQMEQIILLIQKQYKGVCRP